MALPSQRSDLRNDPELLREFPPKQLEGLMSSEEAAILDHVEYRLGQDCKGLKDGSVEQARYQGEASMAIGKRVRIMAWGTADNRATTFNLDMLDDPYCVGTAQPAALAGASSIGLPMSLNSVVGLTGCCAPGAAACTGY
jgi:hypothetical protein